jgi:hypothetical protein
LRLEVVERALASLEDNRAHHARLIADLEELRDQLRVELAALATRNDDAPGC